MKALFSNLTNKEMERVVVGAGIVLFAAAVIAGPALAGTNGQEFDDVWATVRNWTEGSLGRVISGSIILVGIVMGIARQSIMSFAVGLGGGIGLFNAPAIIENVLTGSLPAAVEASVAAQHAVNNLM